MFFPSRGLTRLQSTFKHFARENHLHDFDRAACDFDNARIRIGAADGVIPNITPAAKELQTLVDRFAMKLRGRHFEHRSGHSIEFSGHKKRYAFVGKDPRHNRARLKVGEHELCVLEISDASSKGSALGPINNKPQYDRVKSLIADCEANGYAMSTGYQPEEKDGYFIPVTLVDNPPEDSRIVVEEQFGPVLPLLRWSDEADVIARANNSEYGLGGTIWTNDYEAALRIAPQLETGSVWINEAMAAHPHAAFGGHKQSGLGSENGVDGLLEYTNPQTITVRRPVAA
jgi:hypothetical protein